MRFFADLHVHSRFSRATARNLDLEHLALWGRKKGLALVGTGDFTHPAWFGEIGEKLIDAEQGLFRLRPDLEREVRARLPAACRGEIRFMLQVEIATIYKAGDRTRKVHHLVYAPGMEAAGRFREALGRIGNLASDGRPILGLDSRDLAEIVVECDDGCYLVPAHIWTPWFSAMGSKSGFDSIEDCYRDLADHIFAVETGLSSDPAMNWRVSSLDGYRLVSNSDAHSPSKLAREACAFDCELSYDALRRALETGVGYDGTVEFYPEEGKYHLDGHRKCGVRLTPGETRELGGRCPVCGKPVTVGVMHRVEELADREAGFVPQTAGRVRSLVPLPEILAELRGLGVGSKSVQCDYEALLARLGPELRVLEDMACEEIGRVGSAPLAEAVRRLRTGAVIREAGYDGEYGRVRLFEHGELSSHPRGVTLFEPGERPAPREERLSMIERSSKEEPAAPRDAEACRSTDSVPRQPREEGRASMRPPESASRGQGTRIGSSPSGASGDEPWWRGDPLSGLDAEQRQAAGQVEGGLLILAGPGTGKTRTLTCRIAHLVRSGVPPERCLAITFTRRAADEMRVRLEALLPECSVVPVMTLHALGLALLREHARTDRIRVASEVERLRCLRKATGLSARKARSMLGRIAVARRSPSTPREPEVEAALAGYCEEMDREGLLDFEDLVGRAAELLETRPELAAELRRRWPHLSVDEVQDLDEQQERLVHLLATEESGSLCLIGDPDQSIYGFRGADPSCFERFRAAFPSARTIRLRHNYRSSPSIVGGALQVMDAGKQDRDRGLDCARVDPRRITIHRAPTDKAEAEFVIREIERILGGHSFFSIDSGRGEMGLGAELAFRDLAVLYRSRAQLDCLVEAFDRSGLPFQHRNHEALSELPGVQQIIERLQAGPCTGEPLVDLIAASSEVGREACPDLLDLLTPLARRCESSDALMSELACACQADCLDERAERISLLSLHAAKGLEYAVVFMVGCEDGVIPLRFGPRQAADLEEERRLFFVGMTRARARLFLCHARRRRWQGRLRELPPSPFLIAIRDEMLERFGSRIPSRRQKGRQLELL
ncbi:MAG: UvrD-helicase domain-containing protein [Deltaproteobacteria bacterium]|nr:UvrD-helicase domain-containing protein [Deltaproteobacteria bacterium]